MSEKHNTAVKEVISRVDAATEDLLSALDACTDEQWGTPLVDQERTVGVVIHHAAASGPLMADWALMVARGQTLPAVTMDDIHQFNAQHAQEAAAVTAEETRTLLQSNALIVRGKLDELVDTELAKSAPMALMEGSEITTQQVIEFLIINHIHGHLKEVNAALSAA